MHSRPTRLVAVLALGLALVTALVFVRGLGGGFLYDDYYLVETNPSLRQPGSLGHYLSTPLFAGLQPSGPTHWAAGGSQYWRPFLKLAFLEQYRAFGLRPRGWHVVGLGLHVVCVLLAFAWLRRRLAAAPGEPSAGPAADSRALAIAAALGAALFALHPSRPEAVAWISGSADLWMTFWVLVGLVFWDRPHRVATAAAAAAFALAVLCKETAFVVPLVLAADAWLLRPDGPTGSRRPVGRIGVVAAALALVAIARLMLLPSPAEALRGGLEWTRALASLGLYVARLLWPLYPSTQIGLMNAAGSFELGAWSIALGVAALGALLGLAIAARRRPAVRAPLADAAWLFLPLVPVLNLVPLAYTTLVAERFLYLPLLGGAALAARGLRRAMRHGRIGAGFAVATAAVCAGFGAVSSAYLPALGDNTALWTYELRFDPRHPLLNLYLARAERQAGRLDAALRAARASYDSAALPDARAEAAEEWASIRLQVAQGRERALLQRLRNFLDALAGQGTEGAPLRFEADGMSFVVEPSESFRVDLRRSVLFRSARAVAHARTGGYAAAEAQFRDLLRDDRSAATWGNLARVLACQERWGEALEALATGSRLHPDDRMLAALRAPLERGRGLATRPPSDPLQRAVERARLWIDLGATPLARAELAGQLPGNAGAPALVVAGALADAADGDVEAARRNLLAARGRDPQHARAWDAALADLARQAAEAQGKPARANVQDLFR